MSFVFCAACMCPGGLQKSMRRRLLCPPRNVSLGHRTWNAGHCLSRARAIHHRHGLLLLSADVHIGKVVALQRIFGKTHQICISPMWNKPNVAIPPTWPYGLGHHRGNGIQFLNNTCTGGGGGPLGIVENAQTEGSGSCRHTKLCTACAPCKVHSHCPPAKLCMRQLPP